MLPRAPQSILRLALLLSLLILWCIVGIRAFTPPMIGWETQYDLVWAHNALRALLTGGDPYSPAFAAQLTGNAAHSAYPYPLPSLWLLLPLLPLPTPWAALVWVSISICGLIALAPLIGISIPHWGWLLPLLFYPSVYALQIVQWAPMQLALLAFSLWLFRCNAPFWSGLVLPLITVKPTTGLGLLLVAAVFCADNLRWWQGIIVGGLIWYGIPTLLWPSWPLHWLHTIQMYALPTDKQSLLVLTDLFDGQICFAATTLICLWCIYRRSRVGLSCALLILSMLVTPHRAHYDYPLFAFPFLFLPRRYLWLGVVAVVMSWGLPLTFALGWRNSLQLTLFTVAPAILACAFVRRPAAFPLQHTCERVFMHHTKTNFQETI